MAISRANATKLAAWIALHEPALFRKIYTMVGKLQNSPHGKLGYFGDVTDVPDITVSAGDAPTPDFSSVGLPSADVTLSDISMPVDTSVSQSVTDAINAPITPDFSTADSSSSSGGFWSGVGSGVSSIASAIGKVGSALVSPSTLAAASNAASTYFRSQAQTAQTQAQASLMGAQLNRVGAGYSPAPVSYLRNPQTGALTPVYYGNNGVRPVTSSIFGNLISPTSGAVSPVVLIGGAALVILALLAGRGSASSS